MKKSLVVVWFFLFSSPSFATEFKPEEVPPLSPVRLVVSKLNSKVYFLVAQDTKTGHTYLVINDGERVYVPKMKPNSMVYYDGGSVDFYLESGERVLLPTLQQKENYLRTSLGPTVVYPDRAPTPLEEVKIETLTLARTGFQKFLTPELPKEETPARPPHWAAYKPLQNLESKVVVQIQLKEGLSYEKEKEIQQNLNKLTPDQVRLLEQGDQVLFSQQNFTLLAAPEAVDLIKQSVPAEMRTSFSVFNPHQVEAKSHQLPKLALDAWTEFLLNKNLPLAGHIEAVQAIHKIRDQVFHLTENQKIQLIQGLINALGRLDQAHSLLHSFAKYETSVAARKEGQSANDTLKNIRRTEAHPIRALMLAPLRRSASLVFQILDRLEHPIAREIVVEVGSVVYGAGLHLLRERPSGLKKSYFREWLDQQRADMSLVDRLPREANLNLLEGVKLMRQSHSGGVFGHLRVPGEMDHLVDRTPAPIYFRHQDFTTRLPTFLFGMRGDKAVLKRELVQYIIEADKKAEKLSQWIVAAEKLQNNGADWSRTYRVAGSDSLLRFISGLTHAPGPAQYAVAGFSKVEYKLTVFEILQELLEIASVSLKNTGTYAAVLEASLEMIQNVEREFGFHSREQPDLSQAAVRLQRVVHEKMMNGLNWMSFDAKSKAACAILLSPNPWKQSTQGGL